jgi:hypothetical protein
LFTVQLAVKACFSVNNANPILLSMLTVFLVIKSLINMGNVIVLRAMAVANLVCEKFSSCYSNYTMVPADVVTVTAGTILTAALILTTGDSCIE